MSGTTRPALGRYEAQRRRLAAQLGSEAGRLGWVASGSLVRRSTSCGKPGCRCGADPPQLHGPYWQWTKKVAGKTVTRRLSDEQARLFQEWLGNRERLQAILAAIEEVSDKAATLLLQTDQTRRAPPSGRARSRRRQ